MNNEKYNQIIDEAWENYYENFYKLSDSEKWMKKNFFYDGSYNHHVYLKEEFINKCKTDNEFSEKWGLKIEERVLTDKERLNTLIQNEQRLIYEKVQSFKNLKRKTIKDYLDEKNIPTRIITLTYNNETVITYE